MFKSLLSGTIGSLSMMRFGILVVLSITIFFSISIGCTIMIVGMNCSNLLDNYTFWGGISTFMGTILLNAGVFLGIKAYQKKYENTKLDNSLSIDSTHSNIIV